MQDGAGLTLLTERINETIDKALESDSTAAYAKDLRDATQRLVDVTATLWASGDIATTLANSSIYPRGGRTCCSGVDVARTADRRQRPPGRLLRRQTRCGTVLLRLRAAQGRPSVRSAGQPGSHHRGCAGKLVVIAGPAGPQAVASASAEFTLPLRKVSSVRPRRQYPEMDEAHLASTPRSLRM